MADLRWPAPGTTFGPDRLDEVRALLRRWPWRGVWAVNRPDGGFLYIRDECKAKHVANGQTWTYMHAALGDPPDEPEAPAVEPPRTVTVSTWQYLGRVRSDDPWRACVTNDEEETHRCRDEDVRRGWICGPVVEVRATLPLPVEPAVVVGEVIR